jgi:hypothetical protein
MEAVDRLTHGRFLSIGGGIAIAYIFIDLLPKLSASNEIVQHFFAGFFPYFERHVYVMALSGFLLFFLVDRSASSVWKRTSYWLSLGSYAIFNFLIGYAVSYQDDPSIQPLALFTFAMALHYFTNDYSLMRSHHDAYQRYDRFILMLCLIMGWFTGNLLTISDAAVALINAFIAGGVIMNVVRHELPAENPNNTGAFLLGAVAYTVVLLSIGR